MSYPNLGYNAAEMTYGGAQQPGGYGNQQPGSFGSGQQHPGGYGSGYPGNQQGGYSPYSTPTSYNSAAGGAPPAINPQVQQWFNTVDRDRSGKISAKELQAALVTGQGRNFSDQACSLMIGMFDKDKSGTIDAAEFQQLFNYVNQWLATYRAYDRDQSGTIEEQELAQAFSQMGFQFSPEFIKFLVTRSDLQNHAKITVDQFIVLCVQIQRFTEFDIRHLEQQFEKAKRKRKQKEDGAESPTDNSADSISLLKTEVPNSRSNEDRLNSEISRMKEEMNQLVNENVHLLKENKQLQEDNLSLEDKLRCLHEENERLRKEHRDAVELTSWLSSAREIVQALRKKPIIVKPGKKLTHMLKPLESTSRSYRPSHSPGSTRQSSMLPNQLRNVRWEETELPASNGVFVTPQVKLERADSDLQKESGDESPYHTPLLNFDQVDFHATGKNESDTHSTSISDISSTEPVDEEVDRVGREQLLFPDPIEGVCELCPGSRIYVALSALENILSKKSHSSVARSCLEAIFKMPFLLSCSVQGNIAKGPYGKPDVQRPSLYKPAVECILKYARYHAEQNGWKVEENTTIKKQMNTRLSELRNIAKCKAASIEGSDTEPKSYSRYKNIVASLSAAPTSSQPQEPSTETDPKCSKDVDSIQSTEKSKQS